MRKKILFILLLVFSLMFINSNVDAATKCEKENDLKAEANAIEVNYELIKPEKEETSGSDPNVYYYDVIITNVSDNFEIEIGDIKYSTKLVEDGTLTIRMVSGGYKVRIGIYGSQKTGCSETKLRTISIELPYYNKFSDYEECAGHTNEYPICAPNANTVKYYEDDAFEKEYKKQAEEYKKNKGSKKEKSKSKNGKRSIIEQYVDNAGITVPITILIVIAIVGYIYKIVSADKKKAKIDLGDRKHENKKKNK